MSTIYPTSVPSKRLSESITGVSTSFKLNSITGWDGNSLTSSDFGSVAYAVFRNSAGTLMEIMEIDPTTITSASSPITINKRGLKFTGDLTTEVSANKLTWVKGDTIVELGTDVPQLLKSFVDIYSAQTVAGVKTFTATPINTGGNPTASNELATKGYVDLTATGTATTNKQVLSGTAGETIAAGNLVYLKTSDSRWWKADADAAGTSENILLGIAQGAGTAGNAITSGVLVSGLDTNQTGLSANTVYYVSNTAGALSSTPGTKEVTVGVATSTTTIHFFPRYNQQLTENQQDLVEAIEAGTDFYAASSAGTDSYAITITPPITAYTTGMKFRFKTDVGNTGAATLNVSSLGAKTIKKNNDQDLATGDIEAGQIVDVVYDGTNMQMQSQVAKSGASNTNTFTAGETVTAGQPAVIGTGNPVLLDSNFTGGTQQTINTTDWVSQSFTTSSKAVSIKNVVLLFRNISGGFLSRDVTVSIRANSAGQPTGADIETKTATASSGSIGTNAYTYLRATFSSPVTVSASTTYHIVIRMNGANFVLLRNNTAGQGTNSSADSGGTWSAANGKVVFMVTEIDTVAGRVYTADADAVSKLDYFGFFTSSGNAGDSISVQTDGVVSGLSGLTAGTRYYASDTAGSLSSTMGTYEVPLGIAVSTTELLIEKPGTNYIGTSTASYNTLLDSSQTIIVPSTAKYAVVKNANRTQIIVYRTGITSQTIIDNDDVGATVDYAVSWSGDFLVCDNNVASSSIIAYFYK